MIHVLDNLPKEYNEILHGLENHLMATGDDALMIDLTCKKTNHPYEKIGTEVWPSKKFEKAERAIDGDEDNMVLCSLTKENKKENEKKK